MPVYIAWLVCRPVAICLWFSIFFDAMFYKTGNTGPQPMFADIVQAAYSFNRYSFAQRYSTTVAP